MKCESPIANRKMDSQIKEHISMANMFYGIICSIFTIRMKNLFLKKIMLIEKPVVNSEADLFQRYPKKIRKNRLNNFWRYKDPKIVGRDVEYASNRLKANTSEGNSQHNVPEDSLKPL